MAILQVKRSLRVQLKIGFANTKPFKRNSLH